MKVILHGIRFFTSRTLVCSIYLVGALTINITLVGSESDFLLRGIFQTAKVVHFSIESHATGRKGWIAANKDFEGLTLESYDSVNRIAHGMRNGVSFELPLLKPEGFTNTRLLDLNTDPALSAAEKEAATQAYKRAVYSELPPVNHFLYSPMKQAADNRVATYRQALNSQKALKASADFIVPNPELTDVATPIPRPRIRNRVNSRIWASDHIEIHGLPELP